MNWINIKERKPERNQYVLVETKYCKYPATVAVWTGISFKSIDDVKIENIDNISWSEISEVPQFKDVENESNYYHLKQAIECIDESFVSARKMKNEDENINLIYDSIGFLAISLSDELKKIETK